MNRIVAGYKQLAERIDALSLRERGLVFAGVLGLLYASVNTVVFPRLQTEEKVLRESLAAKQTQVTAVRTYVRNAAERHGSDPNTAVRARIAALKKSLDGETGISGVVAPNEMAKLVRRVLARHGSVAPVRLQNLPAEPFGNAKNAGLKAPTAVSADAAATLYRHGVRVEVEGRYADLVSYLQSLERLPWGVMWDEVQLSVEKYPTARLSIVLYTLSAERSWIGM